MGRQKENLIGLSHGALTVIAFERSETRNNPSGKRTITLWRCQCDCGREHVVMHSDLKNTKSRKGIQSCGCEINLPRRTYSNELYKIHRSLVNDPGKLCLEWAGHHNFELFWGDSITMGYKPGMELVRIDESKPYSEENCKWIVE